MMSIKKRMTQTGPTDDYYYDFTVKGKRYRGVCAGCTTKQEAQSFERRMKETAKRASEQKTVNALVENFKQELTGGRKIKLQDAFSLFMAKPRRKQAGEGQRKRNESNWNDFLAFMNDQHPDILYLDNVTKRHAEEYIQHLREHGRYVKVIMFERGQTGQKRCSFYPAASKISARTVNSYHKTMKSVFAKLKEDAGILYNPFDFEMMNNDTENREAFTLEELKLINDNMDSFLRPLFVIGTCTGLSKGDICLLRWDEIKDGKWICRRRNKTKVPLEIPIMRPLAAFLREQRAALDASGRQNSVYVLPEHAEMYQRNPDGLTYRVKRFLDKLGIQTTRKTPGRDRLSSIKDIHSLRHTFAYLAGCNGVPLSIVQSILGHMSPEMTKHYQAHADREMKERFLSQLPEFIGQLDDSSAPAGVEGRVDVLPEDITDLRSRLILLVKSLPESELARAEEALMSVIHSKTDLRLTS